jgi:glutamine synthetase adenylyltransferase
MIAVSVTTRTVEAGEHLQLLRSLAAELENAMQAIARNDIDALEQSIAKQQEMSSQLGALADGLGACGAERLPFSSDSIDPDLMTEIREANGELQRLNLRYSILLKHSSRSVALMASLFSSLRGEFREASGIRLKQQTWSCQV